MRSIIATLLLIFSIAADAEQVSVTAVRYWTAPDHVRVVLDTSAPVEHSLFALDNPHRLVIDMKNVRLKARLDKPMGENPFLRGIRSGIRNQNDLRVVLDLKGKVRPKSFVLKPNKTYGHRLVFDLYSAEQKNQPVVSIDKAIQGKARDIVIAVDAGHGGEDPGATGPRGTKEKDVTLAIARKLAERINREPGMKAVLVREGDYYIGLRKRMAIARKHRADLFVSIHADSYKDKRVTGSSVYTLSRSGATSEAAKWLAEKENAADLVGGVSLDDKDDVLASVLLDLSQTATLQASGEVAHHVYSELCRVGKVHGAKVQRAGFAVLKSPDIPSLLIETAFITNPVEERNLTSSPHQAEIAGAIMRGIKEHFYDSPPVGTKLALMLRGKRGNTSEEPMRTSSLQSDQGDSGRNPNRLPELHAGQLANEKRVKYSFDDG